jgi:hypothetical protein
MSSKFQRTLCGRGMATFADVAVDVKTHQYWSPFFTYATRKAVIFTRIPTIILAEVNSNRSRTVTETPATTFGCLTPLWVGTHFGKVLR